MAPGSEWKDLFKSLPCCRSPDAQEPLPKFDVPASSTVEELVSFLDDILQVCEQQLKREPSANMGSDLISKWADYKDCAGSFVDGLPKNFTTLVTQDLFVPLLHDALKGLSRLHWVAAGLSLLAWAVETMDTTSKNWENCLVLLQRAAQLMKLSKKIWLGLRKSADNEEIFQASIVQTASVAISCVQIMRMARTWRCLSAKSVKDLLARESGDLDKVRQDLTLLVGTDLQAERPEIIEIQLEYPLTTVVGGSQAEIKAMNALESDSNEVVGVCLLGMGGCGKTTAGMNVLTRFQQKKTSENEQIYICCSVELPLEATTDHLVRCQKQILDKLRERATPEFNNCRDGKTHLEKLLKEMKKMKRPIFLFLDNILDRSHLLELLPEARFFPSGSRIVVTSRVEFVHAAMKSQLNIQDCSLVEVELLDKQSAKALLWKNIKQCDQGLLNAKLNEQEEELLKLCGGLPLALVVMGSYICEQGPRSVQVWENAVRSMKEGSSLTGASKENKLYKCFEFSIRELDTPVRNLFLDILASTYGKQLYWEEAEGLGDKSSLETLQKRALVEAVEEEEAGSCEEVEEEELWDEELRLDVEMKRKRVRVHDVLKTVGLQIAEENKGEVRIVTQEMLDEKQEVKALGEVVGLVNVALDARLLFEMPRLRFLLNTTINGNCPMAKLTKLKVMVDCARDSFMPFNVTASKNLQALTCNAEFFYDNREIGSLIFEEGSTSNLKAEEGFSRLDNVLNARHSLDLSSIAHIEALKYLAIHNCNEIQTLPCEENEVQFENLQYIELQGCSSLQALPQGMKGWLRLQCLNLTNCGSLQALPEGAGSWSRLQCLNLTNCGSLQALPEGAGSWSSLQGLYLKKCSSLCVLPKGVGGWSSLQRLVLEGCSSLQALPEGAGGWSSLQRLALEGCSSLQALPEEVGGWLNLQDLNLYGCSSLWALPEGTGAWSKLRCLVLKRCSSLRALPEGVGGWLSLQYLYLNECSSLHALPEGAGAWSSLCKLDLTECNSLRALPEGVGGWLSLQYLSLKMCSSLQVLPKGAGGWSSLLSLQLDGCSSLQALPEEVRGWSSLQSLYLSGCSSLQALPEGVRGWSSLQFLYLNGCSSLQALPEEVREWSSLLVLFLIGCSSLEALPEGAESWSSLVVLSLDGCSSLEALPEGAGGWSSLQYLSL